MIAPISTVRVRIFLFALSLPLLLVGCGKEDPWTLVRAARAQFEAKVRDALPEPGKGTLQLELFVERNGSLPLETLTLRIDQVDAADAVVRADLVSIDVSGIGIKEAREVIVEVPWGGPTVIQVAPVMEPQPQRGRLAEYPEFAGLQPTEE